MDLRPYLQMTPAELSDFCDWLLEFRNPDLELVITDQLEAAELEWRLALPVDWRLVDREAGPS